jgi:hypothetical protein
MSLRLIVMLIGMINVVLVYANGPLGAQIQDALQEQNDKRSHVIKIKFNSVHAKVKEVVRKARAKVSKSSSEIVQKNMSNWCLLTYD